MANSFKVVRVKEDGHFSTRSAKSVTVIDEDNNHRFIFTKDKDGAVSMNILPYNNKKK